MSVQSNVPSCLFSDVHLIQPSHLKAKDEETWPSPHCDPGNLFLYLPFDSCADEKQTNEKVDVIAGLEDSSLTYDVLENIWMDAQTVILIFSSNSINYFRFFSSFRSPVLTL